MLMNSKILVIQLSGGLGNQLYQLNNAVLLKKSLGAKYILFLYNGNRKGHEYPRLREVGCNVTVVNGFIATVIRKAIKIAASMLPLIFRIVVEDDLRQAGGKDSGLRVMLVCGQWAKTPSALVRRFVRLRLHSKNYPLIRKNRIIIHMRFGDYQNPEVLRTIGALPLEYYRRAIGLISSGRDKVYVVSDGTDDEIESFIKYNFPYRILREESDLKELVSMASASALITANSTFSLWAAYLGGEQKVVVPLKAHKAYNPRFSSNWIKLVVDLRHSPPGE